MRGDLIEPFKMFRGFDDIGEDTHIVIDQNATTHDNGDKIAGKRLRSDEDKQFFLMESLAFGTLPRHRQ